MGLPWAGGRRSVGRPTTLFNGLIAGVICGVATALAGIPERLRQPAEPTVEAAPDAGLTADRRRPRPPRRTAFATVTARRRGRDPSWPLDEVTRDISRGGARRDLIVGVVRRRDRRPARDAAGRAAASRGGRARSRRTATGIGDDHRRRDARARPRRRCRRAAMPGTIWVAVSPWIPGTGLASSGPRPCRSPSRSAAAGLIEGEQPRLPGCSHFDPDRRRGCSIALRRDHAAFVFALVDDWLERRLPHLAPGQRPRVTSMYAIVTVLGLLTLPINFMLIVFDEGGGAACRDHDRVRWAGDGRRGGYSASSADAGRPPILVWARAAGRPDYAAVILGYAALWPEVAPGLGPRLRTRIWPDGGSVAPLAPPVGAPRGRAAPWSRRRSRRPSRSSTTPRRRRGTPRGPPRPRAVRRARSGRLGHRVPWHRSDPRSSAGPRRGPGPRQARGSGPAPAPWRATASSRRARPSSRSRGRGRVPPWLASTEVMFTMTPWPERRERRAGRRGREVRRAEVEPDERIERVGIDLVERPRDRSGRRCSRGCRGRRGPRSRERRGPWRPREPRGPRPG